MRINLPNRITLARLLLAILFFVLLAQYDVRTEGLTWILDVCIVLFIVAAGTDWLDGYLARKRNQVTDFGQALDPVVDKVLVCGTFVFLAGSGFTTAEHEQITGLMPWMVVLILGRELLVTGLRGFAESKGTSFAASMPGKAKMFIQSVTAPVLMFFAGHVSGHPSGQSWEWLKTSLVWLTVAATALSMIAYLYRAKRLLIEAASS